MGATKEELKLDFEFTNTFTTKDEDSEIPVFLRHRGIQGTLKASKVAESGGLDKVKLVLKGMRVYSAMLSILQLTICRIFNECCWPWMSDAFFTTQTRFGTEGGLNALLGWEGNADQITATETYGCPRFGVFQIWHK